MSFAFKFCIVAIIISTIFAENTMNGKSSDQKSREIFVDKWGKLLPMPHWKQTIRMNEKSPGQKSREKCSEYGKLQNDKDDLDKFAYATVFVRDVLGFLHWICSGSLISEKFVLTAAQCMISRMYLYPIKWVRLGHPTDTTKQIFFEVSAFTVHPDYSTKSFHNDIALIELKEHVDINLITPTCLDTKEVQPELLFKAVWIYGENRQSISFHIMKVVRDNNEDCANEFNDNRLINGLNNETQMCTQFVPKPVLYCTGSAGGALQTTEKNADNHITYSIVGITSFGKVLCSDPAIYTKIFPFLSWIESIVWS